MNNSSTSAIGINITLIDWVTVTSWEKEFNGYWCRRLKRLGRSRKGRPGRQLQYDGETFNIAHGTGFIGETEINGRQSWMLRLSGGAAHENIKSVLSQVRQGFANVTRIDIQITVLKPDDWSQWNLLKRLKEARKMTGWVESKTRGDAFETVYIGSRSSDRFSRIYTKKAILKGGDEGEETMLLRVETEYKGRRAHAIANSLARNGEARAKDYLMYELQNSLSDNELQLLIAPHLLDVTPTTIKLHLETSADKTERWLLKQVLPTFARHIRSDEASTRALDGFLEAICDVLDGHSSRHERRQRP